MLSNLPQYFLSRAIRDWCSKSSSVLVTQATLQLFPSQRSLSLHQRSLSAGWGGGMSHSVTHGSPFSQYWGQCVSGVICGVISQTNCLLYIWVRSFCPTCWWRHAWWSRIPLLCVSCQLWPHDLTASELDLRSILRLLLIYLNQKLQPGLPMTGLFLNSRRFVIGGRPW